MHLIEVLVEEDGDLKDRARGESGHAHAAVPLQSEQRAKALLAAPRRAERDQEVRGLAAPVPKAVRRSRRDDELVARAESAPSQPEPEEKLARNAREPLPLVRVHMRRDEAARADEQLAADGVVRPHAEDDALSTDGVADRVYRFVDPPI
jgi:hypothetical protein